jgi:phosphate transport system permease protein
MGYHIYVLATQSPNAAEALPLQYSSTLVLLLLAFSLNITAGLIRMRIRKNNS